LEERAKCAGPHLVNLAANGLVRDVNSGDFCTIPATTSGTLWDDLNGNRERNAGEPPLAGEYRLTARPGQAAGSYPEHCP
jgi:hypothetical protein